MEFSAGSALNPTIIGRTGDGPDEKGMLSGWLSSTASSDLFLELEAEGSLDSSSSNPPPATRSGFGAAVLLGVGGGGAAVELLGVKKREITCCRFIPPTHITGSLRLRAMQCSAIKRR